MSGAHKTQSLKLNLTCLTKSSLTQQGIQNGEHVQENDMLHSLKEAGPKGWIR